VYVTSAALYNDGSPAHQVILAPYDAILLQRQQSVAAPAFHVSPAEVKVIALDDDTIGQASVGATTPQGASYPGTVLKQKLAPAFFTSQSGTTNYVVAMHQDGTFVGPSGQNSRPPAPGEVIKIQGTGFGANHTAHTCREGGVATGSVSAATNGIHWRSKRGGAVGRPGIIGRLPIERQSSQR